jgi:hypothetical protein
MDGDNCISSEHGVAERGEARRGQAGQGAARQGKARQGKDFITSHIDGNTSVRANSSLPCLCDDEHQEPVPGPLLPAFLNPVAGCVLRLARNSSSLGAVISRHNAEV